MVERQQSPEIKQDLLKSIYGDFESLAFKYGNEPSEGMGMSTDGRILATEIPNDTNPHKHPDFLSGRYFGPNTSQMEIMFRNAHKQIKLELLRSNDLSGKVIMASSSVYEVVHIKKGAYTLNRLGSNVELDDLNNLIGFLKKAEPYLKLKKDKADVVQNTVLVRERKSQAMALGLYLSKKAEEEKEKKRRKKQ